MKEGIAATFINNVKKALAIGGIFSGLLIGVITMTIASTQSDNSNNSNAISGYDINATGGFPEAVEAYRSLVTELCNTYNTEPEKLNLPEYVNAMLALIQIESGGSGTDPMQASECGYNKKYERKAGAIKDPKYSLECGIQYARDAFILFGVQNPNDFDRMAAAVQGYNFGIAGWFAWISKRGGKYTVELATQYSNDCMPVGAKGTPTHAQKFLNAYKGALSKSAGGGADLGNMVYYKQWDSRWASYPYGRGTIQSSGCGITCMAMIVATLADKKVTPPSMADLSMDNGGYIAGQGSSMPIVVAAAAKKYSLEYKAIEFNEVEKYLNKGAYVVWGCNKGYFSNSPAGHVMIIRGMKDGKILLADPNREENNTKTFEPAFIQKEAKGYYIAVWK
ncbi:MAG: lysozyme family protein [Clostridium sp.]|nr:lysozyme family protein [Clostridium sp.]